MAGKSAWSVLPKSGIKLTNKNAKHTKTEKKWAAGIHKTAGKLVGGFR